MNTYDLAKVTSRVSVQNVTNFFCVKYFVFKYSCLEKDSNTVDQGK